MNGKTISRTDLSTTARYLEDAAKFYRLHGRSSTRITDRARLMNNMARKIRTRINLNDETE